jgi:hypothetical protein
MSSTQTGLKHIPDTALRTILPHLRAALPPATHTAIVRPEDAPALSFEAGRQAVVAMLEAELQARERKGSNG